MVHPSCNGTLCHSCLEVGVLTKLFCDLLMYNYFWDRSLIEINKTIYMMVELKDIGSTIRVKRNVKE